MKCTKFLDRLKEIKGSPDGTYGTKEVLSMLWHAAECNDCSKAYDDWYYSTNNVHYEQYMKEDPHFRFEVRKRKVGP
jgi:uncharacterized membrane protein